MDFRAATIIQLIVLSIEQKIICNCFDKRRITAILAL